MQMRLKKLLNSVCFLEGEKESGYSLKHFNDLGKIINRYLVAILKLEKNKEKNSLLLKMMNLIVASCFCLGADFQVENWGFICI